MQVVGSEELDLEMHRIGDKHYTLFDSNYVHRLLW